MKNLLGTYHLASSWSKRSGLLALPGAEYAWLLLQREALLGTAVISNLLRLLQSPQKLRQAAAVEALAALLAGNQALAAQVMQLHDLRDSLLPLLRGADVRTRFLACSCLVSISFPAAQVEEAGEDTRQQEAQVSETGQVGGAD